MFHDKLDETEPRRCPHCGSNHASLMVERYDYYCFICGWRESEFFNHRLNELHIWEYTRLLAYEKRKEKYRNRMRAIREQGLEKKRTPEQQSKSYQKWVSKPKNRKKKDDYNREYQSRPEVKERMRIYMRERRARKKEALVC